MSFISEYKMTLCMSQRGTRNKCGKEKVSPHYACINKNACAVKNVDCDLNVIYGRH